MKLLVDWGNSTLKWAWWQAGGPGEVHSLAVERDVETQLDQAWGELPAPAQVWVADVGGRARRGKLTDWIQGVWNMEPCFAQSQPSLGGVTNGYEQPAQLGVDRWLAMAGAYHDLRRPLAVIDAGTALTIDVVGKQGSHQGGLIVPGLELMQSAVRKGTAIPKVKEGTASPVMLARDTHTAVAGGSLYALVAFIDRVLGDVEQALGVQLRRYITGGNAELLLPLLAGRPVHRPALVLEGLALYAEESP